MELKQIMIDALQEEMSRRLHLIHANDVLIQEAEDLADLMRRLGVIVHAHGLSSDSAGVMVWAQAHDLADHIYRALREGGLIVTAITPAGSHNHVSLRGWRVHLTVEAHICRELEALLQTTEANHA